MVLNWFNRVSWSATGDPEDWSGPDTGFLDIVEQGGSITGLAVLGDLFFIFQEKNYSVWQYQAGNVPFYKRETFYHGCNHQRTIVETGEAVYYLSDSGDIRVTNGSQDIILSEGIKPITLDFLNNRSIKDYYSGTAPDCVPHAFYDKVHNAYRLFYAGSSGNTDKCLTYFIDNKVFTTCPDTNFGSSISVYGFDDYISMMGNSDGDGTTNYLVPGFADPDKMGTWDLGWISSGNAKAKVKVYNVEIWFHAEAGETAADDCNCPISIAVYNDPSTNTVYKTVTDTLAYNDVADNLQRKVISVGAVGDYIRLVLTDVGVSASNRNYNIDKCIVKFDIMDPER